MLFIHPIKEFSLSQPIKKALTFSRPIKEELPSPPFQSKKDCHSPLHSKKIFCSIPCSSQLVTGIKFQIASLWLCCFTISITCRSWHSLPSGEQHNKISCTRPSILQLYDEYSYKKTKKPCMKNFCVIEMIFSTGKGDITLLLTYQCHPKGQIILLKCPKFLFREKDVSNKTSILMT